ncbi:RNA dependent RNA polymerase-domain-containing protein [Xylariaceae sp. FL1272]|nr:RNA dependent RNA polymerase-domain-containing protein [Xylariaceae sp. FL1272]
MSTRQATRRVASGAFRRSFSTRPALRRPAEKVAVGIEAGAKSSWTGRSVFAFSAAAGMVGFGLAKAVLPDEKPTHFGEKIAAPRYASLKEMETALSEIRSTLKGLGEAEDIISIDAEDLQAHGYSEWSSVNPDGLPVAVAYPRSTEQVSVIARVCNKYRIPIIGYSGGSSLEGHFSAPYGGVSVDFAYMDQIIQFNKEDMDIVVQPSIGWQDLNAKLLEMDSGLFFPVDPGPSAKIGGMIGTNCSGTNAVRYGTMKDWVINLTVVLADGTVIKTRRRPRKSSAGYNLNSMFVGSEGTLGLVTEATLKLAIIPEETSVVVVSFPTIRDAASAAAEVARQGIPVGAMEIMDEVQMKVVNLGGQTAPRVWKEAPTLFFKFSGTKVSVKDNIKRVQQITKSNKGSNFEFAKDEKEQKMLWSARKEALWSMLALRKEGEEEMDDMGLFASILGHIGDGNFHESILYNRQNPAEREKVEKCVHRMVDRALEMEGTCTGEHSIGWGKKESLMKEVGPETVGVMMAVKAALDPNTIDVFSKATVILPRYKRPNGALYIISLLAKCMTGQRPTGNQPRLPRQQQLQMRPEWQSWESLIICVHALPKHVQTQDLWTHFKKHGNVVWIEISKDTKCTDQLSAKLRFCPPPARQCWGGRKPMSIDGTLHQVNICLQNNSSYKQVTGPHGDRYPAELRLELSSLQFGMLKQEDKFMAMRSLETIGQNAPIFVVNLVHRKIFLRFFCKMNNRIATTEYKTEILFSHMTKLVLLEDGETCSMLIPLQTPPVFWKRTNKPEKTHSESLSWSENETWNRAADIAYDTDSSKIDQAGLRRAHQFIDIGQWTVYKVVTPKSNANMSTWHSIFNALREFNIPMEIQNDIRTVPAEQLDFLQLLEPKATPRIPHSNLDLLATTDEFNIPFEGFLNEVNLDAGFLRELVNLASKSRGKRNRAKDLLTYVAEEACVDEMMKTRLYPKRLYEPMALFKDRLALSHYPELGAPDHCTMIRKLIITPSTIIPSTPIPEASNRVLRHYSEYSDHFLRVQFSDELVKGRIYACPNSKRDNALFNRVFRVLANGVRIGGRHFEFLAFGNSQLREHGAWFFSKTDHLTCDDIRQWMGDVNHIRIVAKYAARLGQCFSTTRAAKGIPISQKIENIDDVERNGWLAEYVAKYLRIFKSNPPSAYQIRLGGSKGLLVLRPSQRKFEAASKQLEIIRVSQFTVATLNRQTITILSCLGVPDDVFLRMQKTQMMDYDKAIGDPAVAMHLLTRFMITDGFMHVEEPFFMWLLQVWRAWSLRMLREKARIVVEKGAFVFGCVDETSTLRGYYEEISDVPERILTSDENDEDTSEGVNENADKQELAQIFLQIPKMTTRGPSQTEYVVVEGPCVVGRNPSLHPGDIRIVEAVDVPALHHIRDCVVFPSTGDRDIPSMCSGGDLDGDDFFVIWDPDLLPKERNYPPMTNDAVKPKELHRDVQVDDLKGFFAEYMKNDSLRSIATAHLAQADKLRGEGGPKHSTCVQLARLHSNAVDYNKSGEPAHMDPTLRPREKPHFMEPTGRRYISHGILGQLYDATRRAEFSPNYSGTFDERIMRRFQLSDETLKQARIIKRQHDKALRQIMNQREIGTEFEVWSTFVLTRPRFSSEYKLQEDMGAIIHAHKDRFRNACIRVAGSRHPDKLFPFIAAAYRVTWEEVQVALCKRAQLSNDGSDEPTQDQPIEEQLTQEQPMPLISFPWIFEREMGLIARMKEKLELEEYPTISDVALLGTEYDEAEYEELLGTGVFDPTLGDVEGTDGPIAPDEFVDTTNGSSPEATNPEEEDDVEEEEVFLDLSGETNAEALERLMLS